MRGGNDAYVDRGALRCADWAHHALLQHTQHLDLNGQRHVADFVEKQRAALGCLEQAFVVACGAGECSLGVAEQF